MRGGVAGTVVNDVRFWQQQRATPQAPAPAVSIVTVGAAPVLTSNENLCCWFQWGSDNEYWRSSDCRLKANRITLEGNHVTAATPFYIIIDRYPEIILHIGDIVEQRIWYRRPPELDSDGRHTRIAGGVEYIWYEDNGPRHTATPHHPGDFGNFEPSISAVGRLSAKGDLRIRQNCLS